jgi:hypothetical protein
MSGRSNRGSRLGKRAAAATTALAVVAAACSAAEENRSGDAAEPTMTGQTISGLPSPLSRLRPGAPCPVTKPTTPDQVPAVLARGGAKGWYGTRDLWVLLRSGRDLGKFPSVTMEDGEFTSAYGKPDVRASRLDGPGRAQFGFGGYATESTHGRRKPLQFWPTGVGVSAPGCWMVTLTFRSSVVRVVVRVPPDQVLR